MRPTALPTEPNRHKRAHVLVVNHAVAGGFAHCRLGAVQSASTIDLRQLWTAAYVGGTRRGDIFAYFRRVTPGHILNVESDKNNVQSKQKTRSPNFRNVESRRLQGLLNRLKITYN